MVSLVGGGMSPWCGGGDMSQRAGNINESSDFSQRLKMKKLGVPERRRPRKRRSETVGVLTQPARF